MRRVEEVRRLAGRLLNADPLDVAFVKNTSEGIGIVAEGFPWRPGDNVVTAAEEYPANLYPWMNLAGRGVEVRARRQPRRPHPTRRPPRRHRRPDAPGQPQLRRVRQRLPQRPRRGRRPVPRARRATSSWTPSRGWACCRWTCGSTPIDFLAADGHKWLLGPEGAGLFYVRRELVDLLHPVGVGWNSVVGACDFARIDFRLKPHAGRWESGTPERRRHHRPGGQPGTAAGDRHRRRSPSRVLELTDYLCEQAPRGRAGGVQQPAAGGAVGHRVAGRAGRRRAAAGAALPGGGDGRQPAGRPAARQPALPTTPRTRSIGWCELLRR